MTIFFQEGLAQVQAQVRKNTTQMCQEKKKNTRQRMDQKALIKIGFTAENLKQVFAVESSYLISEADLMALIWHQRTTSFQVFGHDCFSL